MSSSLPIQKIHRIGSPKAACHRWPYRFHPPQQVRNATCAEYVTNESGKKRPAVNDQVAKKKAAAKGF